jgi:hypothetical protein
MIKKKLFYILVMITISGSSLLGQSIALQNTNNGKIVKLDTSFKVEFATLLDSSLRFGQEDSISLNEGKIVAVNDSMMILEGGVKVRLDELVYFKQTKKSKRRTRAILAPFMIAGWGVFIRGVTMGIGEGLEEQNKVWVPAQAGAGLLLGGLTSIPFLKKDKKYLTKDGWTIVQLNI